MKSYKIFEKFAAWIRTFRLVLKLSPFKKRRVQCHSRIGEKRVMILKEVKRRHISGNI